MARYLIKFTKGMGVKFISHLDLMKSVQRAIRRSGIPVSYSKGFNPHTELSFATPLSVGMWSTGEYMDMKLDERIDEMEILNRVNDTLPESIRFINVKEIDDKFPAPMAIVSAASYEITIVNIKSGALDTNAIDDFKKMEEIEVIKSGKKGDRKVNIKPMLYELTIKSMEGGQAVLSATVTAGSSNLNPGLIVESMKLYIKGMEEAEIRDIKKIETYAEKGGGLKNLIELAESGCK